MTARPSNDTESNSTAEESPKRPKLKKRPYYKNSSEDIDWALTQPECVMRLWLECCRADQFGGSEHILKTSLSQNSFKKARKALEEQGLFSFTEIFAREGSKRAKVVGYKVRNLQSRRKVRGSTQSTQ